MYLNIVFNIKSPNSILNNKFIEAFLMLLGLKKIT